MSDGIIALSKRLIRLQEIKNRIDKQKTRNYIGDTTDASAERSPVNPALNAIRQRSTK